MKLLTYVNKQNKKSVGILSQSGHHIHPLPFASMLDLIEQWPKIRTRIQDYEKIEGEPLGHVNLQAPIPTPRHDVICIGLNYLEHALESARSGGYEYKKAPHPVYFSKRSHWILGSKETIPAHQNLTSNLDYETELAVIIGKECHCIRPEQVREYIFGYSVSNDVSARDLQLNYGQYYFGKSLDGFLVMGPWITTIDEFDTPPHLQVKTWVNDELRQNSNTRELIFDIPHLISELSMGLTLYPGDILLTGTPSGVGMGFSPPRYLKPNDKVKCEIEGLGNIINYIGS